jgi:hypothetical protein
MNTGPGRVAVYRARDFDHGGDGPPLEPGRAYEFLFLEYRKA